MKSITLLTCLLTFIMASGCSDSRKKEAANPHEMSINRTEFGKLPDGVEVLKYTLENRNGTRMSVLNYGGVITELWVADKNGKLGDVVLGFDNLEDYLYRSPYFGSITGRYANRIAKGSFSIGTDSFTLAKNNIGNHLHGGLVGFDKVVWDVSEFQQENGVGLRLARTSPHLEEGYPGNLEVEVIYFLNNDDEIEMEYRARTDQATIVNLTNHSYWNLTADPGQTALDQVLTLAADQYLPVDSTLIPTGELRSVTDSPFDFTIPARIGERIDSEDTQLKIGNGYDHCWIFTDPGDSLKLGGMLVDEFSGRVMRFYTTEPAVQFYSGNFLDGSLTGKYGKTYQFRNAVCLETQHYPDSPNKPDFPSTLVEPGEEYYSKTVYAFSTQQE